MDNQYPLILGLDFLTKPKGVLDFGNSTLQMNDKTYDLTPPPHSSTLVRSKHAQIIDAFTSTDMPVYLTRPVETACMLVEPISSSTRCAPGLEVPITMVSPRSTGCQLTTPLTPH